MPHNICYVINICALQKIFLLKQKNIDSNSYLKLG